MKLRWDHPAGCALNWRHIAACAAGQYAAGFAMTAGARDGGYPSWAQLALPFLLMPAGVFLSLNYWCGCFTGEGGDTWLYQAPPGLREPRPDA